MFGKRKNQSEKIKYRVKNMNMDFERKLAIPMEVKEMYPLTGKMDKVVEEKRAQIQAVFEGRSDKLLLIIGPCSADNEESVSDYIGRLSPVQEKVCLASGDSPIMCPSSRFT